MADLLKNKYDTAFFNLLTRSIEPVVSSFNKKLFVNDILVESWEQKELKARMHHIATVLKKHMQQSSYKKEIEILQKIIAQLRLNNVRDGGFEYMFFPDFIEQYGLHDFTTSMKAFEFITPFTSCEFAIRPFIIQHPEETMQQMHKWSTHKNDSVRRFSSEGCRPRLPWAMALPQFKKNAAPILPILENLKCDESEYVRKSVANNLNDISKDNPNLVINLAKKWKGSDKNTNWIVKHGCRGLLKQANPDALALFDFSINTVCEIRTFSIAKNTIQLGEHLNFSFHLIHQNKKEVKLRIEYAIYYMKSNGQQNRKLFKVTENTYLPNTSYPFQRKQAFQNFTTRKHYAGVHALAIVVNGIEIEKLDFQLKV